MKIHCLQHVSFEGPSYIEQWAKTHNYNISKTKLYNNETLPEISSFDLLVVMGGPMSVSDEDKYSWMKKEKEFIKEVIKADKYILGICLGAQLLAEALEVSVHKNNEKEIGWFKVKKQNHDKVNELFENDFIAFHWHGETFDIPQGAIAIASSEACKNQGFIYNEKVYAFQFHLESTEKSVELMLENCANDLTDDKYVQTIEEIIKGKMFIKKINENMCKVLNVIEKKVNV